jgi:DNA-binding HxlR family transcriptional regulator
MRLSKINEADRQAACEMVGGPEGCPGTRQLLDRLGDKWSVLVILHLEGRTQRFGDLKRLVDGISQRMLTLTLRGLERDGLVQRSVYAAVPPRVEYRLTPLGRTLLVPLNELSQWASRHRSEIARAREEFDARARDPLADELGADDSRDRGSPRTPR